MDGDNYMRAVDLKRLIKLFSIAPNDSVYFPTEGVKLEKEGTDGTIKATATNAAILTEILFVDEKLARGLATSPRMLSHAALDHLKAYLKEFAPEDIPADKIIDVSIDFPG